MSKSLQIFLNVVRSVTASALLIAVSSLHAAPQLVAGGLTNFSIDANGVLYGWGGGANGVGTQTSKPIIIDTGYKAVAVGGIYSGTHTIGIKKDGTLWTFGGNDHGQLGDGSTQPSDVPMDITPPGMSFVSATAGDTFGLAIASDNSLWAWGDNTHGQLGDGTEIPRFYPTKVGIGFVAVAAGGQHALGVKTDGSLWTWGGNGFGQLGNGGADDHPAPLKIGDGYSTVAAGVYFSLALKIDGSLWAWGENSYGQLGDGTAANRSTPVRVGGTKTFAQISAGGYHAAAIANDLAKTVYLWGDNAKAQLGNGSSTVKRLHTGTTEQRALVSSGSGYTALATGRFHTSVLAADGTVQAWGGNDYGQLADGSLRTRGELGYAVNTGASDLLDLDPTKAKKVNVDALYGSYNYLVAAQKTSNNQNLNVTMTDKRIAASLSLPGTVYFTALLPRNSPIIPKHLQRDGTSGMVPVTLTRGGYKQTGPTTTADENYAGNISGGSQYDIYQKSAGDPLLNSNAVICMGITIPALSAKGQVLMRAIATGDKTVGVAQCPTVQTAATTQIYTVQSNGLISSKTITAVINPLDEDREQQRNIYSWAIAPDGTQLMQTAAGWTYMAEPMQAAKSLIVPASGPVTLPITNSLDLTSLIGTLVYIGLGSSWDEVKKLNKAGHYYTVQ